MAFKNKYFFNLISNYKYLITFNPFLYSFHFIFFIFMKFQMIYLIKFQAKILKQRHLTKKYMKLVSKGSHNNNSNKDSQIINKDSHINKSSSHNKLTYSILLTSKVLKHLKESDLEMVAKSLKLFITETHMH